MTGIINVNTLNKHFKRNRFKAKIIIKTKAKIASTKINTQLER